MKPHATHPDWLVDDRGHTWRRVRVFGCEHHPYGPPTDEHGDEHIACAAVVRGLWDELGSWSAIQTVTGCTREQIDASHQELGLCCAGHRWRYTGALVEVGLFEQFIRETMPPLVEHHKSVLLEGITRAGAGGWQGVRIPLIVSAGSRLPRTAAAEAAYKLDPSIPPTVE